MSSVNKAAFPFDKARLDSLLNKRFFYAPAFEIYGGKMPYQTKRFE
jgi:glycyl-tRNA synthetase